MLIIILIVLGIANLAVQLHNALTLKHIGEEINQIENWKGMPKKHYF